MNEYGDVKVYKSWANTSIWTAYERMGTRPIPTRFYILISLFKFLTQNEIVFNAMKRIYVENHYKE